MIDDAFVNAFLEDDKQAAAPGIENKATYTRAEVDDIVQKTIQSTMEALKGQMNDTPESQVEEKEEETNGSNEESDSDSREIE